MNPPTAFAGATTFADLTAEVTIPADGTLSRTLYNGADLKAVLFGFAPGQELSEHTAAVPAVLHVLDGEARVTLGDETLQAGRDAWIHLPAHLPHGIAAITPVKMLLLLVKGGT